MNRLKLRQMRPLDHYELHYELFNRYLHLAIFGLLNMSDNTITRLIRFTEEVPDYILKHWMKNVLHDLKNPFYEKMLSESEINRIFAFFVLLKNLQVDKITTRKHLTFGIRER